MGLSQGFGSAGLVHRQLVEQLISWEAGRIAYDQERLCFVKCYRGWMVATQRQLASAVQWTTQVHHVLGITGSLKN
jgi:hypothetical protein